MFIHLEIAQWDGGFQNVAFWVHVYEYEVPDLNMYATVMSMLNCLWTDMTLKIQEKYSFPEGVWLDWNLALAWLLPYYM